MVCSVFILQNLDSGYSDLDEDEKDIFNEMHVHMVNIIKIIIIMPIIVHIGFYSLYIWYLEKKEPKEELYDPS